MFWVLVFMLKGIKGFDLVGSLQWLLASLCTGLGLGQGSTWLDVTSLRRDPDAVTTQRLMERE